MQRRNVQHLRIQFLRVGCRCIQSGRVGGRCRTRSVGAAGAKHAARVRGEGRNSRVDDKDTARSFVEQEEALLSTAVAGRGRSQRRRRRSPVGRLAV